MRRSVFFAVALAVAMNLIVSAQQTGPNINMAAGSDIYLQRQNELAVGVSSVNPDHMIAFWNDWRTIDQAIDMGAGTTQGLLARLFRLPKKQPAPHARDVAAAEGWTGVGISNNGGWNWSSGLVPGFPGDTSPEGAALRAHNFEAMADPWVSCDPINCHVVTIAFTRGGASSLVYFRYTDQNKSETGHNWKLTIAPTVLRKANNSLPGKFNDKPTVIGAANGQVLIGVVEFDGQDKGGKFQSKVLVSRSADNGLTWSTFEKISQTSGRNQSPFFVLDPNNPAKVWAFWRVFGENSIVSQRSLDGGVSWLFNKPTTILSNYQAFDQVGQQMPAQPQFRTNAYATGGIDGSGVLHLALSERVNASGVPSAGGTPRIVVTSSYDGGSTWTPRKPVAMLASGPQFMPAMTIVGAPKRPGDPAGKTRAEIFLVYYGADPADIPANSPGPIAGGNVRFHTYLSHADTWNVNAAGQVNYDPAKQVSRYQMDAFNPGKVVTGAGFGVTSENRGYAIFYGGSGGFTGDYNIVTPRVPYVKTKTGGWRPTTAIDEDPSTIEVPAPSVQVAWADTRDVILPTSPAPADPTNLDTYAWYNYSPPGTGAVSACNAGSRNQNPYMAEVTMGVLAAAPLTYKDPNLPRSYPLYVQNRTNLEQVWRATIDGAAMASFNYPFPNAILRQEAEFVLKPYSTVTGTVFVNQSYSTPFKVTFQRLDNLGGAPLNGPATFTVVTLNTTGGTDPAATTDELHDPLIADEVLVFTHPPDGTGKLPVDPYVQDDPHQNPLGQNPLGQNPLGQNPFGQNPLGQNAAPKEITDYTYRLRNGGTTHSAYKTIVELQQQLDPTLYNFRILVNRVTRAPGISRKDCKTLGNQFQPVQISNMETPLGQNPLGQNPLGQNPFGQNPLGQNPLGQNPFGQNPLGQNSIVSDNSTFYVAPSKKNSSAALTMSQQQLARGHARPAGGGRLVRVSSPAEYFSIQSSSVDFSLGERETDEVWWTLRVSQLRDFKPGDVKFSPNALSFAVIAQAPNVKLVGGTIVVTDPPAAFKAPDLVYTGALSGIPASASPGSSLTLPAMTAQNVGNASAVPFRQGLYLRSASLPEGVLLGQGDPTAAALDPGASPSPAVPGAVVTIPLTMSPGSYEACAVLDPTNVVRESRENNNFTCVPLVLLSQPDLQIADYVAAAPPLTAATGSQVTLSSLTMRNQGSAINLGESSIRVGWYLSPDAVITDTDRRLLTVSFPGALPAGGSVPISARVLTIPADVSPGIYYVGILVDRTNSVAESNESNNYVSEPIAVTAPAACLEPPANMIAWWPGEGNLRDIKGGYDAQDASEGGFDFSPGKVGRAMTFNGDWGHVIVNEPYDYNPETERSTPRPDLRPAQLTVDFWFKSNLPLNGTAPAPGGALNRQVPFVVKLNREDDSTTASKGYDFFYESGALRFGLSKSGYRVVSQTPISFAAGEWHHVTGTFDGTLQKLYVDGTLRRTVNWAAPSATDLLENPGAGTGPWGTPTYDAGITDIVIGRSVSSAFPASDPVTQEYHFHGQIDEIELFSRALSAAEVLALYETNGKCRPIILEASTATSYPGESVLALVGEPLTLTASVVPVPPEGSMVEFLDGATVLATRPVNADGVATLTTSTLSFAVHSLTARAAATPAWAHPSAVLTQHMARRFDSLAALSAVIDTQTALVQNFNSLPLGTGFKYSFEGPRTDYLIPGQLWIYSAFSQTYYSAHHLEVYDGGYAGAEKVLFGYTTDPNNDPRKGYQLHGGGYSGGFTYYQLSFEGPLAHNALGFDIVGQDPTSTPAEVTIITEAGGATFRVSNPGPQNSNKFVGMATTLPINFVYVFEGCQAATTPCVNAPIKFDNFIIARPPGVP